MSFYQGTAPVFIHMLTALSAVLKKGQAYAEDKNIKPEVLLNARLYPTMFSLTNQVQLACDFSGKACARLTQTDVPSMPDDETTFEQLYARIDKVIANIKAIPPEKYEGGDTRDVTFPTGKDKTKTLAGQMFFNHVALPNFFFHVTTAYDILRHNGVELGKMDFLGVTDR
ncbi:MAG: DUF1993 domain-containing protein [Bradyrhizobiaceae bacterium]|nr:MAG: DUF1993 domain-containing protein [Bradyrhizobiaceae bacterium]